MRDKNGRFLKGYSGSNKNQFKKGHKINQGKGEISNAWKGGKPKMGGYIYVYMPNHPFSTRVGYVLEHRLLMEKHLGRLLLPTELVHHINGDTQDNRIENLMLFSGIVSHLKFHRQNKINGGVIHG